MSQHIVCVVGNPNCGKTTFFNALTGSRQRVGNWPGVTVDKKTGNFEYRNEKIELVDLPGIYSITPAASSGEDERVARDYILSGEAEAVINIVDASNLERNLYLTAQLIEMRVPMIVVVNMLDIAKQHRLEIRLEKLQEALGCPVVGIVASRETGLNDVKDTLVNFLEHPTIPPMAVEFDEKITKAIAAVSEDLKKQGVERAPWFASQFMERAPGLEEKLPNINAANVEKIVADLDKEYDGDLDIAIANARYNLVANIAEKAIVRVGEASATLTDKIDRVVLNRWLGLPIFLFIMFVMFLFTQNLGGAFIDFFDILVGGVMVDGFSELLTNIGSPEWLTVFLANGIGGGLQTVSTFIPVVFFLFLFLPLPPLLSLTGCRQFLRDVIPCYGMFYCSRHEFQMAQNLSNRNMTTGWANIHDTIVHILAQVYLMHDIPQQMTTSRNSCRHPVSEERYLSALHYATGQPHLCRQPLSYSFSFKLIHLNSPHLTYWSNHNPPL